MRFMIGMIILLWATSAQATQVQEVVGKSGVRAWLIEDHVIPTVSVKIAFLDAGYATDPKSKEGRAALVTVLLNKGAGELDALAFQRALEAKAIKFGTDISDDYLTVQLGTLSENTPEAFRLMGLAITKPRFEAQEFTRSRTEMMNDLRRVEENPAFIADRAWRAAAFGNHPYAHTEFGTQESISAIKREDMTRYASHYLTRGNMVISVAGDITPAVLAEQLDAALAALPEKFQPESQIPEIAVPQKADTQWVKRPTPQTIVHFILPGVKRDAPDFFPAYVLNHILGGGSLTTRLSQELREKRGLAYAADTELDSMRHSAVLHGDFATRNEKVEEAVEVMRTLLKNTHEQGVTDAELEEAKLYITGSFPLQLDSNDKLTGYLSLMQIHGLGKDYLEKRNDYIRAVTRDQVNEMAKKLLAPDKLLVILTGKGS